MLLEDSLTISTTHLTGGCSESHRAPMRSFRVVSSPSLQPRALPAASLFALTSVFSVESPKSSVRGRFFMVIHRMLLCFVLLMTGSVVLADSWSPISIVDAPTARAAHSVVFTRIDGTDQMIVWGGQDSPMTPFANTGARWKRSTNVWAVTTTTNAPSGREGHPAVCTGHEMLIWGADDGLNFLNTGGRYDPVTDTW